MSVITEVTNMNAEFETQPLFIPVEERIDKLPSLVHHRIKRTQRIATGSYKSE